MLEALIKITARMRSLIFILFASSIVGTTHAFFFEPNKVNWYVSVYTSNLAYAGTSATVYFEVYGDKGNSGQFALNEEGLTFYKGKVENYWLTTIDLGKLYKIRVWHDNSWFNPSWHLDRFELQSIQENEIYTFKCGCWLATDIGDREVVREIPAEAPSISEPLPLVHYVVQVYTGNMTDAGTDANVYINIFGDLGDTGRRVLKYSKTNSNTFEKGQMDEFEIEAVTLRTLRKIIIGHDGAKTGPGWFLDRVVIFPSDQKDKEKTTFNCNRWLAEDADDGKIERELLADRSQ